MKENKNLKDEFTLERKYALLVEVNFHKEAEELLEKAGLIYGDTFKDDYSLTEEDKDYLEKREWCFKIVNGEVDFGEYKND